MATTTLFVTAEPPFPPTSGVPLRNWQNVAAAARLGDVAVVSVGHDAAAIGALPGVRVWEHVVVPRSTAPGPRGYPLLRGDAARIAGACLERAIDDFTPDVVVFENLWFDALPDALRRCAAAFVLDSHNVYATLTGELAGDVADARHWERDAIAGVDAVWVCSAADAEALDREYAPRVPVRVIPNGIDVDFYAPVRSAIRHRPATATLLFVGAFWYEPNRVAAEWLIDEIAPRVRARMQCPVRLCLVGSSPSPAMIAAAKNDAATVVCGRVPDVRPYLKATDCVVVPLRHGGGTRLKLLEAFAAQRPVVSTAKGAEGLDVRDGEHLLVRDDAESIAVAVAAILDDPDRRHDLAQRAFALVEERYSWNALRGVVRAAVLEAQEQSPRLRSRALEIPPGEETA